MVHNFFVGNSKEKYDINFINFVFLYQKEKRFFPYLNLLSKFNKLSFSIDTIT